MGAKETDVSFDDAGELLADTIITLIRALDMPNGLNGIGYTNDDIDGLVTGALPQKRVLGLSPRPVGGHELKQLFSDSMKLW
jgi:alcohol dehydrogenase class IV